jgi:type II secretory pathway component PulK
MNLRLDPTHGARAARRRRRRSRGVWPPASAPGSAQEGIALIIVMISIFVLTMLAGGFALSMKVETRLARNANSETELEWLGRSAVECARWELAQQYMIPQEPYDGLDQVWAGGQGGIGTSNSPLADFRHEIDTKDGRATWTIIDHERKANINLANEAMLQQALLLMGADAGEMTPVVNSILDWMDPNTASHRVQGAKDDYYQGLTPPYHCKDGPIDDISELLLIKGISDNPALYFGPAVTNYQPGFFNPQANRPPGEAPIPIGLKDLFTPLSVGKININTASPEVLQLIPGIPHEAAEAIVAGRSGQDDGSGLLGPYKAVAQVQRVPEVTPIMSQLIQQYCDVRSYTFEVHVDAVVAGYHRHFVGIIGRPPGNPRGIKVLDFYWND